MEWTFDTPGPTTVSVKIPGGHIAVEAAPVEQTTVHVEPTNGDVPRVDVRRDGQASVVVVEADQARRFWQRHSYRVRVRCPEGTTIQVKTAAADVVTEGRLGSVDATTASGDVRVDHAGGVVSVRTASGEIAIGEAAAGVEARGVSSDVTIGRAFGQVRATTASGDIRIRRAESSVQANTVSGDQTIEAVVSGSVWLESISGSIAVGVDPGVDVWLDLQTLSGQAVSELTATDGPGSDPGAVLEVRLKSLSGDLRVRRSSAPVANAR